MQRIAEEQKTEIIEYESLFLQHRLCSDPDDIIRKEALDLIAEKETLSKGRQLLLLIILGLVLLLLL